MLSRIHEDLLRCLRHRHAPFSDKTTVACAFILLVGCLIMFVACSNAI
jgi:hypothetical protein